MTGLPATGLSGVARRRTQFIGGLRRVTNSVASQAVAITGDPDSPVIFNLRLGDGLKTIEHEPAPEALAAPLVAIAAQGDEG